MYLTEIVERQQSTILELKTTVSKQQQTIDQHQATIQRQAEAIFHHDDLLSEVKNRESQDKEIVASGQSLGKNQVVIASLCLTQLYTEHFM